jgi:hypothetical protein
MPLYEDAQGFEFVLDAAVRARLSVDSRPLSSLPSPSAPSPHYTPTTTTMKAAMAERGRGIVVGLEDKVRPLRLFF